VTVPGQDPATPGGETPPAPPAPQPAAAPAAQAPAAEPFDAERARRTIEAQREEERKLKAKLKELEPLAARARELEDAQRTDLEKAQAKADALQAQLDAANARATDALIRAAVEREAHAQGADPRAIERGTIARLVDTSGIEWADDGTPKGADKAVKALLEAEPYLKAPAHNGGAAVPGTPRANGNQTRGDLVRQETEQLRASGRYSV
jgi:hypothetical protein